jgi:hypothetical protein
MEIGLGQLRLSPDDFWRMTPLEFLHAQKGFFDMYKTDQKEHWRRTIELINIQLKPGKRINVDALFNERPKAAKKPIEDRLKDAERLSKLKPKNGISSTKFNT